MRVENPKPVLFLAFIGLIGLGWFGCARSPAAIPPPAVPDNLKVPGGQVVLLKALGKGVQIYACQADPANPAQFEWTLKAPEAELLNDQGARIGKHYAGPTWEASDGSKVVGALLQRADAPSPKAVAWLLLKAKSNEGTGTFRNVTYVQRVNTEGGQAPSEGCDPQYADAEVRVAYQANYYFYVAAR